MSDDWSSWDKVCGNCKAWQVIGWPLLHETPCGIGGPGTDGTVSPCRRQALAVVVTPYRRPIEPAPASE
jgi:hypothetical protein